MSEVPSFGSCRNPPLRIHQVDGCSDVIGKESKAGSLRNGEALRHGSVILPLWSRADSLRIIEDHEIWL